ncbi:MAG: phage tail tape measure protein, partial [Mesorhizobium sp.]|uniref:phage tail tape measure protein n=1 Tax=Mesorhizobium sp. TaxID=1871066 RepID=UPI000FE58F57
TMANVSTEQFVGGMSKLNKAIAEAATSTSKAGDALDDSGVKVTRFGGAIKKAADGTKQAGTVFDRLGVKIRDANGNLRSNEAILLDVADAFARMPDSALKSALAIELFGKAGAELLPFLNQARAGILDLGKQAEQLGIVLTKDQANIGDALGDSLDSLSKAARGARLQLGLIFAPGLTALANGFADIIASNRDVLIQFGQAINRNVLSVVGDLLHLLSGNTQNIKNPWIKDWSAAVIQFGSDVAGVFNGLVLPAFKALREGAQFVAQVLNRMFGTDITAGELALGAAVLSLVGVFSLLGSAIGVVVAGIGLLAAAAIASGMPPTAAAVGAGILIGVFWQNIQDGASDTWQFITEGATAAWQAIVDGATGLWQSIVGAFEEGKQLAVDAFNGIVEAIVNVWNGLVERLGSIAQQIVERIAGWFGTLPGRITSIFNSLLSTVSGILGRISSLIDSITSKIRSAIDLAKQLVGLGGGGGDSGGGGSQGGFAGGGYLAHGPGTPTSDSIPIWASVKEFITRAKAVAYYGPGVYHAMNAMKIPREFFQSAGAMMRGFNLGGLVDRIPAPTRPILRFANGGQLPKLAPAAIGSSTTPLHFHFASGQEVVIDAVGIGDVAMGRLRQEAQNSARTTAGRKPGWK